MNEQIYNDLMARLDVLAEKMGTVGSVLYQQALLWNYVKAGAELGLELFFIGMVIWSWHIRIAKEDYDYGANEHAVVTWIFRALASIALLITTTVGMPECIARFSAPSIGAINLLLRSVGI
jgi:hypothetical protein